nr:reverse transcriptase domain-containing protein [Tanacetum cinerariifolium]
MRTRSQSRHNSPQQEASQVIVEPLRIELPFQEDPPPEVLMADNRTMAELLQAPTEGYEDTIVIPEITANNFELKHVVAKVSTSSSTPAVSSEVAKLKDLVRALLLDKKNQSLALTSSPTHAPVKAVEPNCVTCGGTHSYQNCPATSGNVYRDNIQEYVSQATAANYNQGNTSFRPQMVANQFRPPGFPPHQNNQNNFNRGNNFNQNRGGNFSQSNFNQGGNFNQGQLHRPQVNQPPAYQAPIHQTLNVSNTDFESYIKANDAILRNIQSQSQSTQNQCQNIQNQYQNLQMQMANLTDMVTKLVSSNAASSSGSGTLLRPTIPTPSKQGTKVTKEQVKIPSSQSTAPVQPSVSQSKTPTLISEPIVAPVSAPLPNVKSSIPYPSRRDNERRRDQANEQIEKFYEIFKDMSFEISFTDALIIMPKFASTLKTMIGNKEKLRMDECLALADLGASINLMPFFVWKAISLLELTPTYMTLKLADRSVSKPIGIAKDVSSKVGVFHFPADFVVVALNQTPENKAITYNLDQTVRYSANYNQMTANKIDVIEMPCEEYSQEVLGFFDVTTSGNPTPYDDLIVSTTSLTLTSFGDSDFLLFEEADAFFGLEDDLNSPKINPLYYDPEGDILLLETILNSEPLPPLPNHKQYLPSFKKELKGDNKLPIIIAKELGDEEKSALIKVLKSHKRAIAWKLSDIQGINLEFCTHKILIEEDYKPAVQHQRRVNPKIYDVIKKEVEKLLDAGLIYPISDSPWVSPVHCVPKKGGFTVVENEENELIPTRLVTGWRVCIDYRKLKEATRKDHFPLPFMDQMFERLAGNEFYCFRDGFSGYFQIPIDPRTFQRCMLAIFYDMVEKTMEIFMDDFSVFGNSFENCFSRLKKMLQRCEDTNLSLNWEKSHFMVKEGIVHGYKISKNWIKVNRDKVDVIAKLPHPTIVKGVWSFLGHAGAVLGQRHEKHSKPIHYASKTINDAKSNYTTTEKEMLAVVYAFEKFWSYLIMNKSIVHTDHSALKYLFAKKDAKVMLKYGVTHRLSTAYHPQTSGQVEVSNRSLKRILERTIGENRAFWSDKLDDALWAFRTAYKTPIGCTPYKLVYGKACHLPIELKHKAYWALKQTNFDLTVAGDYRKIKLNELNEIRDHAYENSLIYKEKTKRIHESKIKNRVFNIGDRVLLFNSRLKIFLGKLKTHWSGPFTIVKVFPYGTVELSQANGPNFKVNGHLVKHYFGGDVPQLDYPDCEVLHAPVFHSQELHILSFILGIQYPNLID